MVKSEISWAFSKLLFFTWQPASPLSLPWKLKKKKKNGRTNSWDIKPARWGIERGSFHSLVFFFFFLIYVVRNKIIKKKKVGGFPICPVKENTSVADAFIALQSQLWVIIWMAQSMWGVIQILMWSLWFEGMHTNH